MESGYKGSLVLLLAERTSAVTFLCNSEPAPPEPISFKKPRSQAVAFCFFRRNYALVQARTRFSKLPGDETDSAQAVRRRFRRRCPSHRSLNLPLWFWHAFQSRNHVVPADHRALARSRDTHSTRRCRR